MRDIVQFASQNKRKKFDSVALIPNPKFTIEKAALSVKHIMSNLYVNR